MIAPSFGDIFSGNAVQNGLVTAIVTDEEAPRSCGAGRTPQLSLTVDLEQQSIVCVNQSTISRSIQCAARGVLNGWDDLALTKNYDDRIATFQHKIECGALGHSAPGLKRFQTGEVPIQADLAALGSQRDTLLRFPSICRSHGERNPMLLRFGGLARLYARFVITSHSAIGPQRIRVL